MPKRRHFPSGSGTSWLFPFVDGHPPIGWDDALPYLYLPAALLVVQYVSSYINKPKVDPKDDSAQTSQALAAVLPLLLVWFSLNVPSGAFPCLLIFVRGDRSTPCTRAAAAVTFFSQWWSYTS